MIRMIVLYGFNIIQTSCENRLHIKDEAQRNTEDTIYTIYMAKHCN